MAKQNVKVTALAEIVMVHDRYLYVGESRIVIRHVAEQTLAANPGSIKIEELPDDVVTDVQPVTLEETAPAAAEPEVADDSAEIVSGRKAAKRSAVQGRKS